MAVFVFPDRRVCYFFLFIPMYTFKIFIADDINEDRMIALRKHVVFVKPNNATELMQSPFLALKR